MLLDDVRINVDVADILMTLYRIAKDIYLTSNGLPSADSGVKAIAGLEEDTQTEDS